MPLHPPLLHLAVVALPVAAALTVGARWRPDLRGPSVWSLYAAAVGAVVATVTGLIDHEPYEHTPLIEVIETHQFLGLGTTVTVLALSVWRGLGLRRNRDPGGALPFQILLVAVAVLVLVTASLGGDLVYVHRVGIDVPN